MNINKIYSIIVNDHFLLRIQNHHNAEFIKKLTGGQRNHHHLRHRTAPQFPSSFIAVDNPLSTLSLSICSISHLSFSSSFYSLHPIILPLLLFLQIKNYTSQVSNFNNVGYWCCSQTNFKNRRIPNFTGTNELLVVLANLFWSTLPSTVPLRRFVFSNPILLLL